MAKRPGSRKARRLPALAAVLAVAGSLAATSARSDALLDEAVALNGQILFFQSSAPGLVIAAIRNGETTVAGFGETGIGSGKEPDGDTVMRIGSVSKVFTGEVLARLVADGRIGFTDPLADWLPEMANRGDRPIRLIDIATQSSGLPREVPHAPGPPEDPLSTITLDAFAGWLSGNDLNFAPGTGISYSNFAFDLLSAALSRAAGARYEDLLAEKVTGPLGMNDTGFTLDEDQRSRLAIGHFVDGSPMEPVPTGQVIVGSGGLYSTANDLLKWMAWHLDRFAPEDAEVRLLDHAAYLPRDGLSPVVGMDESGEMSAVGLGWVVMEPEGNRPMLLQKAGGFRGHLVYMALAPQRDIGIFVAINRYDFATAIMMARAVNDLIAELAPR